MLLGNKPSTVAFGDSPSRNPFAVIFYFAIIALTVMTVSRLGLAFLYADRISEADGWLHLFTQGLRVDFASLCWAFGIAALGTALFSGDHLVGRVWNWVLRIWLVALLWLVVFLEASTPSFLEEYGFRPNRLYVEYLIYPKEVFSMLWTSRKLEMILSGVITVLTLWAGWHLSGKFTSKLSFPKWHWRPVLAILVIAVSLLGARSTLGHRPLNPALVSFSSDPLVNSLVVNSNYSLFFAIKQMSGEKDASNVYSSMPTQDIIDIVRQESGRPASAFVSESIPTLTYNEASYQGKPKNLVIILQESMGAQYVGSLGGLPLTPNIDELSKEGWFFDNLYATGTRSVRGIEAVVTGFTPTPAAAVVKLGKSQTGFFSLAEFLADKGYSTQFIYGGESHFDNMRSFFLGNGFTEIVDQDDYPNPAYVASWGVSDEDLLFRAHEEFEQKHQQGQPFFSLVFTSTNHEPYDYPEGRIEPYEEPAFTVKNAVKYADYAVGEFFKKAKQADYWKDTVFVIVADHDNRVGGNNLVPIPRFRIPGLIIGGGVEPKLDERVVSQIDMGPTLLSLIGASGNYPMLGRDLTKQPQDWPGRALMQYGQNFGLMEGNQVTMLQPQGPAETYTYERDTEQLTSLPVDEQQAERALAWILWGSHAYNNYLYKSQDSTSELSESSQVLAK
ncbi:LTA synthase family protein [Shewanella sp. WXL01]|nr:LTA synthase family protein [Shewanella sp. WXL01]